MGQIISAPEPESESDNISDNIFHSIIYDEYDEKNVDPIITTSENDTRHIISTESKSKLSLELLKATLYNNDIEKLSKLRKDFILYHVNDAKSKNFEEIVFENNMLSLSLEKYKKLYYDLEEKYNELYREMVNQ